MYGLDRDQDAGQTERTPHDGSHCDSQTYDLKSGHESLKGARHQDRPADGPSVAK
jgi:hypothetical protein